VHILCDAFEVFLVLLKLRIREDLWGIQGDAALTYGESDHDLVKDLPDLLLGQLNSSLKEGNRLAVPEIFHEVLHLISLDVTQIVALREELINV